MDGAGSDASYEAFVALHSPALSASGVPARYWPSLWRKLEGEVGAAAWGELSFFLSSALAKARPTPTASRGVCV